MLIRLSRQDSKAHAYYLRFVPCSRDCGSIASPGLASFSPSRDSEGGTKLVPLRRITKATNMRNGSFRIGDRPPFSLDQPLSWNWRIFGAPAA